MTSDPARPVSPPEVTCRDCGMLYGGEDWLDTVLPDTQWHALAPEGGVLCANCIVKRASRLPYAIVLWTRIIFADEHAEFASFKNAPQRPVSPAPREAPIPRCTCSDNFANPEPVACLIHDPAVPRSAQLLEHCPENLGGPGPHSCVYCGDFLPCGGSARLDQPTEHSTREIVMDFARTAPFTVLAEVGPRKLGHNPSWVKAVDYQALHQAYERLLEASKEIRQLQAARLVVRYIDIDGDINAQRDLENELAAAELRGKADPHD